MDEVHVVGAGGIGCALGYALRAVDVPVSFVDTDEGKVAWGRRHGVGVDDRRRIGARFISFRDWDPPRSGTVLLCTKCFDNAAVLARLPLNVSLIPVQNGFDAALEARRHRLEGIASFVSECSPGQTHTRITRSGRLHIGIRHPDRRSTASAIIGMLQTNDLFRVESVSDILPYKYTKLMYNAAISPLASMAGVDNGALLFVPKARQLFFALLAENYHILRQAGVSFGKIGPFHPNTVARILERRWLARALAWAFYPSLRGTYCSMSGDLPRGRTEIDYYNGRLIELAGERPCPLNRWIYDAVKKMEAERSTPSLQMLDSCDARGRTDFA